ncbi:hypothetical protein F0562_010201 [Nyssa sinensis]|uniref:Uncharacterized protein n=1 Tax=Nyssa sinensis TaxID=561372 RepID=A0A5J5A1C5_9ASTE|nr:hypothetical protein F0562_010201 [Nyssa sinensis]
MDSHQFFGYGVAGAGLTYSSSHPTVPSIPSRQFESSKFDIRNSPFSTDFDSETLATFSDSQEQHSSTENLSRASLSCNSSLETCSYLQQLSPSLDCHQDSLLLRSVGRRLKAISEKFKIPVEFHAVLVFAPDITKDMLDVRPGEALAVNFPLQLNHAPDESVDVNNPRDELLRMVKSLSPKVVTLVEQESNINTAPFFPRFLETLEFYTAMFESINVTLPRDRKESINVEQHCLARDIVNIIACRARKGSNVMSSLASGSPG